MKNILLIVFMCSFFMPSWAQAQNAYYTAKNINVSIKSSDLTKARDEALLQAQKIAVKNFVALGDAQQAEKLKSVNEIALSRTMKDFSLQQEKLGTGSYQAAFTIRFDRTRLEGLLAGQGITLPAVTEIDLANLQYQDETAATATAPGEEGATTTPAGTVISDMAPKETVIVLPVLDIGSRRVVWDEPNPWRDSWQKQTALKTKTQIVVPLGDVSDLTDIPDGAFLTHKTTTEAENANIQHILERYSAQKIYILVAKSQGAALNLNSGLEITIFSHDGKELKNDGQINSTARPGYLFDDAVTFTAPKIDELVDGTFGKKITDIVAAATTAQPAAKALPQAAPVTQFNSIIANVPMPSLSAWVKIQQLLRRAGGVRNIVTQTINPRNAVIRIDSSEPINILLRNIEASGFTITDRGNNQYTLTYNSGA